MKIMLSDDEVCAAIIEYLRTKRRLDLEAIDEFDIKFCTEKTMCQSLTVLK